MQREIVALRHQLGVYQKARCRPRINPADRLLQERWLGRLTPAEKKALAALARGKGNPNPGAIKAGTRLYRSWQGVTHEVLVMDSGYIWRDQSYASLSEVARAITGTRWSGPRFFGLQA